MGTSSWRIPVEDISKGTLPVQIMRGYERKALKKRKNYWHPRRSNNKPWINGDIKASSTGIRMFSWQKTGQVSPKGAEEGQEKQRQGGVKTVKNAHCTSPVQIQPWRGARNVQMSSTCF